MSNIWIEPNAPVVLLEVAPENEWRIVELMARNAELLDALKLLQSHVSKMMFVMRHVDRVIERAEKKL